MSLKPHMRLLWYFLYPYSISLCVLLSCSVGHILFYCTPYVIWLSRAQLTKWLPGRRTILTLNLRREGNTEWADGQWGEGAVEGAERGEGKLELARKEVSSWEMEYIKKGEPRHKVSSPSFQYSLWTLETKSPWSEIAVPANALTAAVYPSTDTLATELCHRTCRLSEKWVDFHLVCSRKFPALWHEQDPVRRRASCYAETLSLSTRAL